MGYYKQLHIDCERGECLVNQWETCYQQPDNPAYNGDYIAEFDEDREDIHGQTVNPQEADTSD